MFHCVIKSRVWWRSIPVPDRTYVHQLQLLGTLLNDKKSKVLGPHLVITFPLDGITENFREEFQCNIKHTHQNETQEHVRHSNIDIH